MTYNEKKSQKGRNAAKGKDKVAASTPSPNLGVTVLKVSAIVVLASVLAMALTIPKFDAWCLFFVDHFKGT
jgi:hypothetical protein